MWHILTLAFTNMFVTGRPLFSCSSVKKKNNTSMPSLSCCRLFAILADFLVVITSVTFVNISDSATGFAFSRETSTLTNSHFCPINTTPEQGNRCAQDYQHSSIAIAAMEGVEHRTVSVNGINMHVAIKGPENGPVILFVHGFPELWYSWRHQIEALASLGYRAVAPDMRGYGDTDAPADPKSYTVFHVVGDLIGLLDAVAPHQEKVFVVGHDWGALICWYLCLFRPDKVKALVNLSVPFNPRNPKRKVIETLKALYGDDYYICRFQEPGEIEGEFAQIGTKRVLEEFFTYRTPAPLFLPKGKAFGHPLDVPIVLPPWISEEVVNYYASKYEKKGFTGGINYYRNFDLNWELSAPWTGAKVPVPVKFIVGDLDLTYNSLGAKDYINSGAMKKDVPLLEFVVMKGVAHFIQQEKADEINKHIHDYFQKF